VIHPKTLLISRHFYSLESYVWRSIYILKIDTISTYDIPLDRSFFKLWNGIRHVMPSTDRRLELKEKTSMVQTVWQLVVYAKGIMKSRSTYNLKIDTISTYDIPLDRLFLKLWNGVRHVMPSTDRRLELKEKTSMAQNAWQAFVYTNGLMSFLSISVLICCHNLGPRWVGWSTLRPGRLPLGKTWYPFYRRIFGTQSRSWRVRKNSPPPEIAPQTVQPVASRYTDCAREYS